MNFDLKNGFCAEPREKAITTRRHVAMINCESWLIREVKLFSSHFFWSLFSTTAAARNAQLVAQMQSLRQANRKLLPISLIDFSWCLKKGRKTESMNSFRIARTEWTYLSFCSENQRNLYATLLSVIQQSICLDCSTCHMGYGWKIMALQRNIQALVILVFHWRREMTLWAAITTILRGVLSAGLHLN